MQIRTQRDKYFGDLDVKTYTLTIKDGKNVRQTPIPKEGCSLRYTAGDSTTEVIIIPPQYQLLQKAM